MSSFVDLTGKTFGRLTVIERAGGSAGGRVRWLCQCECGNTTTVASYNLRNGHTRSCGCMSRETSPVNGREKLDDLTGKKFGKLTALDYDTVRKKWRCQCECGNICYVTQGNLTRKTHPTISCGCMVDITQANAVNIVSGTNVGNIRSRKVSSRSKTGIRGVYYSNTRGRYIATIGFRGKQYTLKTSTNINECIAARREAEEKVFGDFLRWYDEMKDDLSK